MIGEAQVIIFSNIFHSKSQRKLTKKGRFCHSFSLIPQMSLNLITNVPTMEPTMEPTNKPKGISESEIVIILGSCLLTVICIYWICGVCYVKRNRARKLKLKQKKQNKHETKELMDVKPTQMETELVNKKSSDEASLK